ncbi:YbhB/YbcL family Raf kinase inhibitor-like protein [Paucibacter sp. DJ2R-2]|uniref:YbhB/YbcL family Raf kinase inhibitor-like protein n=1 Tax=Paucibacter sp. DJ2R-2 TaxID=2893558 RepID=UPI0021E47890|nr:YbhB/YbcL family Raf kinase inhibitor-like protein [Paucibacter sp. DJ2R-2]MCV2419739.1 YbhB/YbcL family Raf kinase inhibitor-like protein [Paucibacter sp. DJ4R-1]MCV2437358.1 YbhB/YbcL family Raf kinase inhibitor-like protein [Paucibacter sp. DJ2R-2]
MHSQPRFRLLIAAALLAITGLSQAGSFQLRSPDIPANSHIAPRFEFQGFGCSGENQSPALSWQGAPAGTQSYAITVYDPDAPTGSGWWHWSVVNLPTDTQSLPAGAGAVGDALLPAGARQVRIDYGVAGWGGMCPPPGDRPHRYIFTVHALKVAKLDLPADATAALAGYMIRANTLATASFSARYGRPAAR